MTRPARACYRAAMKVKRTYKLSADTVATVKRLVEEKHVAASQDALVEDAINEYVGILRDAEEARQWSRAADDPIFQAECDSIDVAFASDDAQAWDA